LREIDFVVGTVSLLAKGEVMHKILEKLKEEFFAVLPPTIFFFLAAVPGHVY
jgi:hypothetical protein